MLLRITFSALLLALFTTTAMAQVGVNNPDPEQALDVNGKIKLADDSAPPTDGTIRYNDTETSFEGYSDGEWKSFTETGTPENVDFRQIYVVNKTNDNEWEQVINQASPVSGTPNFFDAIPTGKKFLVDMVECVARDGQPNEFYYAAISPSSLPVSANANLRNPRIYLSGNSSNGNTIIQAGRAPLFVVHAGHGIAVWNSANSQTSIRVVITGLMVDEDATDDYFSY